MNQFEITRALAAERDQTRRAEASHSWLAALARCCQPRTWARLAQRLVARLTPTPTHSSGVPCCA